MLHSQVATGKESAKKPTVTAITDTIAVPDTGYTGIKQYMSGAVSDQRSHIQETEYGKGNEIILPEREAATDILYKMA